LDELSSISLDSFGVQKKLLHGGFREQSEDYKQGEQLNMSIKLKNVTHIHPYHAFSSDMGISLIMKIPNLPNRKKTLSFGILILVSTKQTCIK